jgi:hypothetical protein
MSECNNAVLEFTQAFSELQETKQGMVPRTGREKGAAKGT